MLDPPRVTGALTRSARQARIAGVLDPEEPAAQAGSGTRALSGRSTSSPSDMRPDDRVKAIRAD